MQSTAIFGPFLATMVLTFVIWVVMYARRIPFLQSADLPDEELEKPGALEAIAPPRVTNASDNLKNLFEAPVLFYALCLYLFVTDQVDDIHVRAAWVFFAFRVLHSAMHVTRNIILVRFFCYAVSTGALWFMLARATLRFLNG